MPSLLEAIVEKYECFEDDTFDQMPIAIYVPRKNPRNMIPNLLVLNDCDIDSAGQESDLRDKCHGVEELDLAQNCLSRWSEVSPTYFTYIYKIIIKCYLFVFSMVTMEV
jgi:tubulin-specific chaperone cofactor E-like protein